VALAAGLTESRIEITTPQTPKIEIIDKRVPDIPIPELPKSLNGGASVVSESALNLEINPYSSCVATIREKIPDLPRLDAIDFPLNTITPKVGDVIKMRYPSNYHIALITEDLGDSWEIYQGNIPAGATSTEILLKSDKKILGYFNMDRQRLIDELTPIQKETLWNESGWSHYKEDGSVIRGKAGEVGVAQWMKPTWKWMIDLRRRDNEEIILLDIYSFEDQIKQFKYGWEKGVTWFGRPPE